MGKRGLFYFCVAFFLLNAITFSQATWTPTSLVETPSSRDDHTAVWTGTLMIIFGGSTGSFDINTGGKYDPISDSWVHTSLVNAPAPRSWQTAVWSGTNMIIWGGIGDTMLGYNTGGKYEPVSDTWTATTIQNAPTGRCHLPPKLNT